MALQRGQRGLSYFDMRRPEHTLTSPQRSEFTVAGAAVVRGTSLLMSIASESSHLEQTTEMRTDQK